MIPIFLVFAVCAFASTFSLRLIDPIILPVAAQFGLTATSAALLIPAYAIPYAIAQPFLGPISDRFGRQWSMKICITGLTVALVIGSVATSFELLLVSRVAAGIFGGGIIPLVLSSIGDAFDMKQRQVMLGRMLFAIIAGQMLGPVVAGLAAQMSGWRSALLIGVCIALLAVVVAWTHLRQGKGMQRSGAAPQLTFVELYKRVFANPLSVPVYACVLVEGMLFFGLFPFVGEILARRYGGTAMELSDKVGLVIGAFGTGGLVYALSVRTLLGRLGVQRMCSLASFIGLGSYIGLMMSSTWWQAAVAMLAAGIAFFMIHNSLQTAATELAPVARGSAVALFASGLFLGQGLGPLLFGPAMHHGNEAGVIAGIAIGVFVLGQFVSRRVFATALIR